MKKLIYAEDLSSAMYEEAFDKDTDMQRWDSGCWIRYKLFENVLDAQPSVDAEPVRHGKWIRQTDTRFGEMLNDILICSECKVAFSTVTMIRRSYCPNCGARMKE